MNISNKYSDAEEVEPSPNDIMIVNYEIGMAMLSVQLTSTLYFRIT
jgi:hypothetical protein